ncbi:type IV pilus assembly protein PilM [Cryocola sp. 340MFSha3.1]|uniref:type IV pilus assembly protein PilM n=1 Tax=Cryocola sp. 340MFSha3.1 TaxID=1169145 RepID=UPI00035EFC6A|nr:type IV pilus assembly protein PilM [Cryocola sp. 340MFSha3.1]
MKDSIVGVDIGSTSIRAVEVGGLRRSQPILLRYHELPLPEGAASRGEVLEPNTVAALLKQLWSRGGFGTKDAVLGMGNQRVLARDLTVPRMSLTRIRESLPFQVQEMLPVPVADALLDFYPVSEGESEAGPVINGLLVAAVKEAVLGNVNAVHLAGLNPVDVDLIPFALCRAIVNRGRTTGTVALVEIGAATTSVVIAAENIPHFVRIIPSGGGDLTAALVDGLDIEPQQAEMLKRTLGLAPAVSSQQEQKAVEIIYQVAGELLGSIRNTINYFVNTRPGSSVDRIVITGGGSQLVGLGDALSEMTRVPVEEADPFTAIGLSRRLDASDLRYRRAALTVSLGLALGRVA